MAGPRASTPTGSRSPGRGSSPTGPGRSTRPAWTSTTGSSTSCSTPASSRWSRCTTGTCRRPWRTTAAGSTATPPTGSPSTPRWSATALGDRVGTVDHAQRAVRATWPRLRHGRARPRRSGSVDALPVAHHLLLGHGLAVARAARARRHQRSLIANNYTPVWPRLRRPAPTGPPPALVRRAAEPALPRPDAARPLPGRIDHGAHRPGVVHDGDLDDDRRAARLLGVNYYNPTRIVGAAGDGLRPAVRPVARIERRTRSPASAGRSSPTGCASC